jgi:hypothetical protein
MKFFLILIFFFANFIGVCNSCINPPDYKIDRETLEIKRLVDKKVKEEERQKEKERRERIIKETEEKIKKMEEETNRKNK